jgi:hypothetical protein
MYLRYCKSSNKIADYYRNGMFRIGRIERKMGKGEQTLKWEQTLNGKGLTAKYHPKQAFYFSTGFTVLGFQLCDCQS